MPPELAEKIARNIAQAVKGNAVKENMQSQGIETQASTPGEFTRLLNSEKNQWSEVVKTIGFKREQ
jgi:tripartite-type tricarboxylate transporter receptor subunit TctC